MPLTVLALDLRRAVMMLKERRNSQNRVLAPLRNIQSIRCRLKSFFIDALQQQCLRAEDASRTVSMVDVDGLT
jgi:hypothetical protein